MQSRPAPQKQRQQQQAVTPTRSYHSLPPEATSSILHQSEGLSQCSPLENDLVGGLTPCIISLRIEEPFPQVWRCLTLFHRRGLMTVQKRHVQVFPQPTDASLQIWVKLYQSHQIWVQIYWNCYRLAIGIKDCALFLYAAQGRCQFVHEKQCHMCSCHMLSPFHCCSQGFSKAGNT